MPKILSNNTLSERLHTVAKLCKALAQSISSNGVTPEMIEVCILTADDLQAIADEMIKNSSKN